MARKIREVPLTKGLVCRVYEADYYLVALHKWQAFKSHRHYYARRRALDWRTGERVLITLSHLLMEPGPDEGVRHKDGDTLNCLRDNLEIVKRRGIPKNAGRPTPDGGASPSQAPDPLDEDPLP